MSCLIKRINEWKKSNIILKRYVKLLWLARSSHQVPLSEPCIVRLKMTGIRNITWSPDTFRFAGQVASESFHSKLRIAPVKVETWPYDTCGGYGKKIPGVLDAYSFRDVNIRLIQWEWTKSELMGVFFLFGISISDSDSEPPIIG